MKKSKSAFHGFRFPASIISCTVRWYMRFNLSLRDIEELLLERGVSVRTDKLVLSKQLNVHLTDIKAVTVQEKEAKSERQMDRGIEAQIAVISIPGSKWKALRQCASNKDCLVARKLIRYGLAAVRTRKTSNQLSALAFATICAVILTIHRTVADSVSMPRLRPSKRPPRAAAGTQATQ